MVRNGRVRLGNNPRSSQQEFVDGHHVLFQVGLERAPFIAYHARVLGRHAALELQMSGQRAPIPVGPSAAAVHALVLHGLERTVRYRRRARATGVSVMRA